MSEETLQWWNSTPVTPHSAEASSLKFTRIPNRRHGNSEHAPHGRAGNVAEEKS
jgi:hypothetical protein